MQLFLDYPGAERKKDPFFPPKIYDKSHFILLLFCVESKKTLQSCVHEASYITYDRPDSPIILVGVSRCYLPNIHIGFLSSNRCVSEEEGNEAAKKIGKILESVYSRSGCYCCCVRSLCLL